MEHSIPAGDRPSAALSDRAGKDHWDVSWELEEWPEDVQPDSPSIWAYRDQLFHRSLAQLIPRPGALALEIGCARSAWLPYLARHLGCRIAGLDYSEIGATQAIARLEQEGIPADIRCADMFDPPADWLGTFDVVVWFGVAEHFDDTTGAVRAASAFLKPGGVLITEIPNFVGINGWLQRIVNRPIYDIHVPLSRDDLARHHAAAGLAVVRAEYIVPTDFGVVTLQGIPDGALTRLKDRVLYALRLLTGCIWWLDRRFGLPKPGRLTSGFVLVAARRPERR